MQKSGKKSALERLKALRQEGKKGIVDYNEKEERVYDEVDEASYQMIVKKRLNDDFVVDDDGLGYADYGIDDFDEQQEYSSDEEEEGNGKSKMKKQKKGKDKGDKRKQQNIGEMLKTMSKKIKVVGPEDSLNRKEEDEYDLDLDQMLRAVDDDSLDQLSHLKHRRKVCKQPEFKKTINDFSQYHKASEPVQQEFIEPNYNFEYDQHKESPKERPEEVELKEEEEDAKVESKEEEVMISKPKIKTFKERSNFQPITPITVSPQTPIAQMPTTNTTTTINSIANNANVNINQVITNDKIYLYWIDLFESQNGKMYLFGKVKTKEGKYVSCCVQVNGLERKIYLLPKEYVETYQENSLELVEEELKRHLKSTRFKVDQVTRKYAFELENIPYECDYVQITMGYDHKVNLPKEGKTYSHVFGANTAATEQFVLELDLMGPGWLEVGMSVPVHPQVSWCRLEVSTGMENVRRLKDSEVNELNLDKSVDLTMLSMQVKTVMNYKSNVNEIVLVHLNYYANDELCEQFTIMRPFTPTNEAIPSTVQLQTSEKAMLNNLLALFQRLDPDILLGHNLIGFDLDVLLHRLKELNILNWSRIGRLKRSIMPKLQQNAGGMGESTHQEKRVASGRLLCDSYLAARELIKVETSYSLIDISREHLKLNLDLTPTMQLINDILSQNKSINHLLYQASIECELQYKLIKHLQFIPLSLQLTQIAGNLLQRTMNGARSERNEYLLLHEFYKNEYILPDKEYSMQKDSSGTKKKGKYAGGLVLEPKKGLYNNYVLLLDFNSLYPSIIQEYNICFTTVERSGEDSELPDAGLEQGILPRLLQNLVDKRRQVKQIIKQTIDPELVQQLNIRQQALKLTANSMYGCLGFEMSRFYCRPLAELITGKGREILQDTCNVAENILQMNVIYGDTDSIMIDTNSQDPEQCQQIGAHLRREVNKKYKLLEIAIDGLYKKMLLLKKKKYAAVLPDGKIETKGLDQVRRDWCLLSKRVSQTVLEMIMSVDGVDELQVKICDYLSIISQQLKQFPLSDFVIRKSLTKLPQDYNDAKSQPHVQVALQMRERNEAVRINDLIPFVKCANEELKFQHPSQIKSIDELDLEYYLSTQILPPVTRLCCVIEGLDEYRLAQSLGLDTSKFKPVSVNTVDYLQSTNSFFDYSNCFKLSAGHCESFSTCKYCQRVVKLKVRQLIKSYYEYWQKCDDCQLQTRQTQVLNHLCLHCHQPLRPLHSDNQLLLQLLFNNCTEFIRLNKRNYVDFSQLFIK